MPPGQAKEQQFWSEVKLRIHTASRLILSSSRSLPYHVYEDLAQDTLIDVKKFVDEWLQENPGRGLDEVVPEALAWGLACLENNFRDLVRTSNRRSMKLAKFAQNGTELEGFLDFRKDRAATPHERAVASAWIVRMRQRCKTRRSHAIVSALEALLRDEVEAWPKDVQALAGVSANDMHHFRTRIVLKIDQGE